MRIPKIYLGGFNDAVCNQEWQRSGSWFHILELLAKSQLKDHFHWLSTRIFDVFNRCLRLDLPGSLNSLASNADSDKGTSAGGPFVRLLSFLCVPRRWATPPLLPVLYALALNHTAERWIMRPQTDSCENLPLLGRVWCIQGAYTLRKWRVPKGLRD